MLVPGAYYFINPIIDPRTPAGHECNKAAKHSENQFYLEFIRALTWMFVDPFRPFPSFRKMSEHSRTKNDSCDYSRERLIIHNYDSHNNQRWELLILMRDKQSVIRVRNNRVQLVKYRILSSGWKFATMIYCKWLNSGQ